jgi:hypothetical protein
MSEMIQGFLACVGAALFFICVLAALTPIISSWISDSEEDDARGAPEGDLVHFRMTEDEPQREASQRWRRGFWPFGPHSGFRTARHSADGQPRD